MPKIDDVKICIVPTRGETIKPVTLVRHDKMWYVEEENGVIVRGLFPSEIKIASQFQRYIIDDGEN